ncbi:MAG: hypothetical protein IT381_20485 [Deltaproteobacteria bacterium]|nr:hypothetical protein [Deltaproteobacteria bacterium]
MRALLLLLSFASASVAFADDRPEVGAPTRLSLGLGELGEQPEAVPASRVLASAKAALLVDRPDFFGTIAISARIRGSYVLAETLWLSFGIEAFEMRNVINASVVQTQYALGPMTTGVHWNVLRTPSFSLSPYLRILWPTSTAYTFARPFGLELGASASYEIHRMLSWISGLMLPLELVGLGARMHARFFPTLATELAFHPARWFDLLAGIEIKFGTDPSAGVEYFAPKAALRFYPAKGFVFDIKGMFPMLGLERNDYVLSGSIGWVFDATLPAAPASAPMAPAPLPVAPAPAATPEEPTTLPASAPASEPFAAIR